ncbi:hypothetical protein HK105_208136 [Polyrhizophydium stewartii]|uniref:Steroid 5-alpha reductase C-terminal domain-containing protein n=1 Tax=Polyrhizophydium stewartii TaxID=2732419 RepID=A0ABR4MYM1_9FUNG
MPTIQSLLAGIASPALLAFGMNAVMFAVSAPLQTEHFFDLTGSSSFVACSALALWRAAGSPTTAAALMASASRLHPRQLMLSAAVSTWAVRLGTFLVYRVNALGGDRRFDKLKTNPARFAVVWAIQAVWTTMTAFPVFAALSIPASEQQPLGLLDAVGAACWAVGFTFEALADYQKLKWQLKMGDERFKSVNREGVWSLCRYPNYFGEILLWSGVAVSATAAVGLRAPNGIYVAGLMALSPLFVATLLLRVSGIPLQEHMAKKRFAGNKDYEDYVATTNVLFPWFPRKAARKSE